MTLLTSKPLARRTVLRGLGAALSLPILDAMTPAVARAAEPVRRFQTFYVPNGMAMEYWLPKTAGADFELTPILEPLAAYRDQMLVLSGLKANWNYIHAGASGSFLTGTTRGGRNEVEVIADVSMDQLLARHFASETQLGSLELAMDPPNNAGACTGNLSCVYTHTLSWRSKTQPLPMEFNPRPLFEPPQFALVLPNARTRNGVGQTVKDLSEDPYAGADVTLTLTAKDEAGNEGRSEPFNMRLPERLFTKPLARALIEQRRILALDAGQNAQVYTALDALMIAPELFTPEPGHYLGLYSVSRQLEAARTDDTLREVVASLWALAVTIEDGNISDVDKALRAAQEALKQALERGATDEEIKKLTDNLRAALDNFLRQLAEQFRNNPQQLARPLDPNTKMLSQQDLKSMLDRLERMSRSGDKDAAKQLLEQLQQMLENLQMAQPGQGGDNEMEQALNELGDMIRKQQQLRDKTYKQGQDSRRDRQRGKQGDQSMGDLQQDQQGLRDRLKKLQEELAKRGMGPGQRGQQGQQGQRGEQGQGQQGQGGEQGDGEDGLDQADSAMGDATGRLGEGNADSAVDSQGRALDALRKGAQSLAEAMQQGDGDQPGDGPGNPRGRQQGAANSSDPLGRPMRHNEFTDDYTVKIPGEIDVQRVRRILEELRRRLADPARPQIELDYIERLLKDY